MEELITPVIMKARPFLIGFLFPFSCLSSSRFNSFSLFFFFFFFFFIFMTAFFTISFSSLSFFLFSLSSPFFSPSPPHPSPLSLLPFRIEPIRVRLVNEHVLDSNSPPKILGQVVANLIQFQEDFMGASV